MRKGAFSKFFTLYQAVFIFIIGLVFASCFSRIILAGENFHMSLLSLQQPISTTCSDEGDTQAQGFSLPSGYFIVQIHGDAANEFDCDTCDSCGTGPGTSCFHNQMLTLHEEGKFIEGSSCSYENCENFCLCLGQSSTPSALPWSASSPETKVSAQEIGISCWAADREQECVDLVGYNIVDNSMCCIPLPAGCGPLFSSQGLLLEAVYSDSGTTDIPFIGFEKSEHVEYGDIVKMYILSS